MSVIHIGIFDEQKLVQEGLSILLSDTKDIQVAITATSEKILFEKLNSSLIHVLLINLHKIDVSISNLIFEIRNKFPKLRILIISANDEEDMILKTIKSGANGFLASDSDRKELLEAIYALRNGHDYYSNSITHLLLNKYISRLQTKDKVNSSIGNLSSREVEIVRLWGESNTNKEIADKLFISVRTVESHKNHIMQKLNLKTTVDLLKFAIKNNIIEI
ncbi:MAG: response regulator transcription factor [Bacteroidales bacterium]|nr:response regulator transcription factor [Bacteroidales bacterium]